MLQWLRQEESGAYRVAPSHHHHTIHAAQIHWLQRMEDSVDNGADNAPTPPALRRTNSFTARVSQSTAVTKRSLSFNTLPRNQGSVGKLNVSRHQHSVQHLNSPLSTPPLLPPPSHLELEAYLRDEAEFCLSDDEEDEPPHSPEESECVVVAAKAFTATALESTATKELCVLPATAACMPGQSSASQRAIPYGPHRTSGSDVESAATLAASEARHASKDTSSDAGVGRQRQQRRLFTTSTLKRLHPAPNHQQATSRFTEIRAHARRDARGGTNIFIPRREGCG